jgi:hypothetical protein
MSQSHSSGEIRLQRRRAVELPAALPKLQAVDTATADGM